MINRRRLGSNAGLRTTAGGLLAVDAAAAPLHARPPAQTQVQSMLHVHFGPQTRTLKQSYALPASTCTLLMRLYTRTYCVFFPYLPRVYNIIFPRLPIPYMPNHDNIRRSVVSSTPPVAPPHSLLRHRAPSARLGGQPLVARQQVPPIRSLHHATSIQQRLTSAPLLHPKAGHPAPASACRQVFRAFPGGPNNNTVTSTVTAPLNTSVRDSHLVA